MTPLEDHEEPDLRIEAPRLTAHPLVALEGSTVLQKLAHPHGAHEAPGTVEVERDGLPISWLQIARLLLEGHEELLGQAPIHEGAEAIHVAHLEECHLTELQLGLHQRGHGAVLRIEVHEGLERIALAHVFVELRAR